MYCVFTPLFGALALWRSRHPSKNGRFNFDKEQLNFLTTGYKAKRYYWEVVILVRKILLVVVIVYFRSSPLSQLYAGLWVMMAALVGHMYGKPMVNPLTDKLELYSLLVTCITLMSGMLYFSASLKNTETVGLDVTLILLNLSVVIVLVSALSRELIVKRFPKAAPFCFADNAAREAELAFAELEQRTREEAFLKSRSESAPANLMKRADMMGG